MDLGGQEMCVEEIGDASNVETLLKVVKHLPYEIMIGRQDMIKHKLPLTGQNIDEADDERPITEDDGTPPQQRVTWADPLCHPAPDNHPSVVESDSGVLSATKKRKSIAPANTDEISIDDILVICATKNQEEHPTMVDTAETSQSDHPVTEVTTECEPMREPINGDTGQTTDLTGNSDNYTDPSPRMILEEFFTIVRDVKTLTRKLGKNKSKAIRSMGRHRLAAVRGAREEKRVEGQRARGRVMTSPTLRHKILHGLSLYRLLTDTSVRQVDGYYTPIVRSHLTPIPCKRRQLIGAARRLQQDVAQGMALALEVPLATNRTEPDEHLNLVRDYQVELHHKLVEPEENRAHMTSYINFEEDALGDDEILGERDTDYFRDKEDDYYADAKDCG